MSSFGELVELHHPEAATALTLRVVMLNVGRVCDLECTHCHQQAGPTRTEVMTPQVQDAAIALARAARPDLVDITGGAPELYPRLRELLDHLAQARLRVRVRTNLVALLDPRAQGLAELFARQGVALAASFPSADRDEFEAQRGLGSFDMALEALEQLNRLGYGTGSEPGSSRRLRLDLVVNPDGDAAPPSPQLARTRLTAGLARHGVTFDDVLVVTNTPVGRFAASLRERGEFDPFVERLRRKFEPATLPLLACRNGIAVGWDGTLADCDFNLGAGIGCADGVPRTIFDVDLGEAGIERIARRRISFGIHCLACSAGSGSS